MLEICFTRWSQTSFDYTNQTDLSHSDQLLRIDRLVQAIVA
ncbi:MAG: hypothetical protein ACO31I_04055 [Prochlorotrichaceae cyanobacterium]